MINAQKVKKLKIDNLEKESDIKYPNWIPQIGEYYAWREKCTRHGDLLICRVIFFDGKLVKGREPIGCMETRNLGDVFRLDGDYEYLFRIKD